MLNNTTLIKIFISTQDVLCLTRSQQNNGSRLLCCLYQLAGVQKVVFNAAIDLEFYSSLIYVHTL